MFAARQGAMDAARALADAGADLNVQDPDGTPALTIAVVNGHHDVARLLLERGANPNVADVAGMTPLYAAVELHTVEMYPERRPLRRSPAHSERSTWSSLLLAKGARPDAPLKRVHAALGPAAGRRRRCARRGRDTTDAGGTVRLMSRPCGCCWTPAPIRLEAAEGSNDGSDAGRRCGVAHR